MPEQEIRERITRYCLPSGTMEDVKSVAKDVVGFVQDRQPFFEMPNGGILYFEYYRNNSFNVGTLTNVRLSVQYIFSYDHNHNFTDNL